MPFGLNQGCYQYNGAAPGRLNQGAYQGYPDVPVPPVPPPPPPDEEGEYRKVLRQYKIFWRYFFLPLFTKEKINEYCTNPAS